jgi:MEDS: MEthanogen/methylotroph, DcmR Sensory domain
VSSPHEVSAVGFRHEAMLYAGADDFADQALPVIAGAVEAGEPVMVAVDAAKILVLRDRLDEAERSVIWKDIRGIGGNPSRIIPLWRRFVDGNPSPGRHWGFGEPVWAGRKPDELEEAQRHEQLLNLAFAHASDFTLLCPYDICGLASDVLHEAHASHPFAGEAGHGRPSPGYPGLEGLTSPFAGELREPPPAASELDLTDVTVDGLHRVLAAVTSGVADGRLDDLGMAIATVAATMVPPGAHARLRLWQEGEQVVAEVGGLVTLGDPLAGREWPAPARGPARGLWLANQVCDLVQVRMAAGGTVVRMRVR